MPRSKPTPTLAQLSRLAKRIRYEIEFDGNELELLPGVDDARPYLCFRTYGTAPEIEQMETMAVAALSALPDAKTKKEKR